MESGNLSVEVVFVTTFKGEEPEVIHESQIQVSRANVQPNQLHLNITNQLPSDAFWLLPALSYSSASVKSR